MFIIADVGGTKMRVARSNDLHSFEPPIIVETPQEYGEGINALCSSARSLAREDHIEAVVIGMASPLSSDKRSTFRTPHLAWESRPFADDVARSLSATVHMENDVALVALGEAYMGAGQGVGIMVYITVSTGVNGARIVDGNIDRSSQGFEIGGQYLSCDDPLLTFEDMVSGTAVSRVYGTHPANIPKDDPLWEELARLCAFGVHNTILHWSPDRVVLGGSMFNDVGIPVTLVERNVHQLMKKLPSVPAIVHSELSDLGGIHGGMVLLRKRLGWQ